MLKNAGLIVGLGLGWGLNWPALKLVVSEIPPWTLRAIGSVLAASLLFAFLRATGQSARVPRRHWLRLACVGALSVAAYNLLSVIAQLTATAGRTAILSYTMPIWAVLLAFVVLGEPLDRRRLLGLCLGTAGLVSLGVPLIVAGEWSVGLAFAIASGFVWALGSVCLKRWPIAAPPVVITAWQIAIGALVSGLGAVAIEGVPPAWPQRTETFVAFAYNIVIGQAIATTLWFTILARMPAGIASIASLLVPGVGVVGAAAILGERPTAFDWLGLVLIVAASASVLVRRTPGRIPADPAPPDSAALTTAGRTG